MKKTILLFALLLTTAFSFAQKKEKLKGSKIVTVTQKDVDKFESLEFEDNLEVFLVKGDKQALEIEADDNLHEAIKAEMYGSTLRIYTDKDITNAKKLSVRVTYTDNLKMISAKNETKLNALADLQLDNVTVKNFDYSKSYLNVKSSVFALIMNDKSKAELNIKAESATIELSKNAELKALIAAAESKIDLYQKATATLEGDSGISKIRLDNNAVLNAKKFAVTDMELISESYTSSYVNALKTISIFATGKSEIQLFGTPKVDMKNFADNATLYKKLQ
ncbi:MULTISPECIES: DUF2807 domain-containing protein [unclassified Flavobacterium]|uniref:GIN domain-containing protein n=1 Tax=unclassified Flavobacterium TaxID=196869 RepID=UPI00086A0C5F|nr:MULTISPECIES: DUF2807 domain-containing protein [unclassified Flavobacterium]MBN9285648.1 DUF2807 domain-containing protein [Flavobacterium sp.]ODS83720.1 MAG: hypothetical protein ABS44_17125 [Chryseobacterium sp. SCN 40-13]OJV70541.1 MAG: DUF2807 domain-containing protein [Flavobacterium sp. 40-81]